MGLFTSDAALGLLRGAAAGAAGTTALNAVTYLDMVLRARGSSSTPEQTVEAVEAKTPWRIAGDQEQRSNRLSGLGALTGVAAGVGTGAILGLLSAGGFRPGSVVGGLIATIGALLVGNGPMTVLGVTDPRKWTTADWVSDVVPHVAYGAVTAATLHAFGS
ncbi:hypothetical protein [Amycolatopsis sp. CA-128772]|uniref:hypothetical protein n=1 Tax=Amycolatopsis sp. CA-128772 TaxID=2073159 RepID=UPI001E2E8CF3|nr:hypothetical protein [Amycolatopsis sp. CA-128772]